MCKVVSLDMRPYEKGARTSIGLWGMWERMKLKTTRAGVEGHGIVLIEID